MDYEKEYKKLKAGISKAYLYAQTDSTKAVLETILPELKESEDERIRKALIKYHKSTIDIDGIKGRDILAWLEKQGGKPKEVTCTHEVETGNGNIKALVTEKIQLPKFHEGEWIIRSAENFKHNTYLIKEIKDYYVCEDLKGRRVTFTFNDVHKNFKLWDISDAKDGDVLVTVDDKQPFIYKGCLDPNHPDLPVAYCGIDSEGYFICSCVDKINHWWTDEKVQPATKEQRDILFTKMKEAGYVWDFNKKELKKIEQKPVWSEKDDSFVQDLTDYFYTENALQHTEKDVVSWLNSLKERFKNGN